MRRILFFILFFFACFPLNAQHLVKYVTFYPTPYGSHENVKVIGEAAFSGVDGGRTEISKTLEVESIDLNANGRNTGNFTLKKLGSDPFTLTGGIYSGISATPTASGHLYMLGQSIEVESVDGNYIPNLYVAVNANVSTSSKLGSHSLSNLTTCSSTPVWRYLRIKGSEACKQYLTCGGSDAASGCLQEDLPDLPECEFSSWRMVPLGQTWNDTCGDSKLYGCVQTHECDGSSQFPCREYREAVYTNSMPALFECGKNLPVPCNINNEACRYQIKSHCGQHDDPKYMYINGMARPYELCSSTNISDITWQCRNNPAMAGCLYYSGASHYYAAENACWNAVDYDNLRCNNTTYNLPGFVCQTQAGIGDTETQWYRVCDVL